MSEEPNANREAGSGVRPDGAVAAGSEPTRKFPRRMRIRNQTDFDRVHAGNAYAADRVLVVRGASSNTPHPRLGLSVPRATGNAVVRNRWKRLIRESFRLHQTELPNIDLVARPRRGAEPPDVESVSRSLQQLAAQVARRLARSGASPGEASPP